MELLYCRSSMIGIVVLQVRYDGIAVCRSVQEFEVLNLNSALDIGKIFVGHLSRVRIVSLS